MWGATHNIATYVCPSNPFSAPRIRDPAGFGGTDYFATVYTDIDPTSGSGRGARNSATRAEGALTVDFTGIDPTTGVDSKISTGVAIGAVSDGTSNTIAVIEDAGRLAPAAYANGQAPYYTTSRYNDNTLIAGNCLANDVTGATSDAETAAHAITTGNAMRGVWRWADADACGSGISGPFGPSAQAGNTSYTGKVINQHNYPIGGDGTGAATGATACAWVYNNCGANDEPFSFHTGGVNCVLVDGSVRFLAETLDPVTARYLVTRSEGVPPGDF